MTTSWANSRRARSLRLMVRNFRKLRLPRLRRRSADPIDKRKPLRIAWCDDITDDMTPAVEGEPVSILWAKGFGMRNTFRMPKSSGKRWIKLFNANSPEMRN